MSCNKKCIVRNTQIQLISSCINNQPKQPIQSSLDYIIDFTVFANVKTKKYSSWEGVSPAGQSTSHIFNIRYSPDVLNWLGIDKNILYKNKVHQIISFENLDEDDLQIIINSSIPDISYKSL